MNAFHKQRKELLKIQDEDALLEAQEQFLKEQDNSFVSVKQTDKKKVRFDEQKQERDVVTLDNIPMESSTQSTEKSSKFKQRMMQQNLNKISEPNPFAELDAQEQKDWILRTVLQEKELNEPYKPRQKLLKRSGFPEAKHRSETNFSFAKTAPSKPTLSEQQTISSRLYQEDAHIDEIDKESDKLLHSMNLEEKNEALQEVQSTLSPQMRALLLQRAQKKQNERKQAKKQEEEEQVQEISNPQIDSLPPVMKTLWKNFYSKDTQFQTIDEEELKKVEWMKDVPMQTEKKKKTSLIESLRFDFEGDVAKKDSETYDRKLYHHGEDPDEPGYTLFEICFFGLQSSVAGQRVINLNILHRILQKQQQYLTLILNYLFENEFIVNICILLNDKNITVSMAALQCLHTLISYKPNQITNSNLKRETVNLLLKEKLKWNKIQFQSLQDHVIWCQVCHWLVLHDSCNLLDRLAAVLVLVLSQQLQQQQQELITRLILNTLTVLFDFHHDVLVNLAMGDAFVNKNKLLCQLLFDYLILYPNTPLSCQIIDLYCYCCSMSKQFATQLLHHLSLSNQQSQITLYSFLVQQSTIFFSNLNTSTNKWIQCLLQIISICISYGYFWELVFVDYFGSLFIPLFMTSVQQVQIFTPIVEAIFSLLSHFVVASSSSEKEEDNIQHLRSFLEEECFSIAQQWIKHSNSSLWSSLFYFASCFYQQLPYSAMHRHNLLDSHDKTYQVIQQYIIPFIKSILSSSDSCDASLYRLCYYLSKLNPSFHSTLTTLFETTIHTTVLSFKQSFKNGFVKMQYRNLFWKHWYFVLLETFSTSQKKTISHSVFYSMMIVLQLTLVSKQHSTWESNAIKYILQLLFDNEIYQEWYTLLLEYYYSNFGSNELDTSTMITSFNLMSVDGEEWQQEMGMGKDWIFEAVEHLYTNQIEIQLPLLQQQLHWLYQTNQGKQVRNEIYKMSPIIQFGHMIKIFLMHQNNEMNSELYFMDSKVEYALRECVKEFVVWASSVKNVFAETRDPEVFDFRFSNMVEALLVQFHSISFGNTTFCYFVSLFLSTQLWETRYQKIVLTESGSNRLLLHYLKNMLPSELEQYYETLFLTTTLQDATVIHQLLSILSSIDKTEDVKQFNPQGKSFYNYCLHHLKHYLQNNQLESNQLKQSIENKTISNEQVQQDLLACISTNVHE